MSKTTGKQLTMKGVIPPLTVTQEAARTYLEAESIATDAKERAKKRKEEMISSAIKANIRTIKVNTEDGYLHTFEIESKEAVKHSSYLEVKVEKVEKN